MKGYSFRSLTDLVLKIFKTKVNAGTGLSGGGSLEADRTLSVKYGTATGTATQGNDSRVVNAASNATVNAKEAALEAKKADKAITITAGTGLSGGGSLAADRSLSVKYGTDSGTAAQGNDSRLSNSREWTAETISQAETEEGTATTRRAFTAQRVRQAIVAWWNSITGAFGRDLVTSANSSVARSKLGLHTSALRWPTWAEVAGKPTTFPSSSHTHPWSQITEQPVTATRWPTFTEVTDKPTNYPTTWGSVAAKPVQATRWPTFKEVSGKPATYTPNSHTHPISQITGLDTALSVKANTSTQVIAGTGLSGGGTLISDRTLSIAASYIPIGVGQTWQDMMSSRELGTIYTNSTGRAIMISVTVRVQSGGLSLSVAGVVVAVASETASNAPEAQMSAIVPPGAQYEVNRGVGSLSIIRGWSELR